MSAPGEIPTLSEDMLVGAAAIADFLGLGRQRVYKVVERGHLPVFHIGALVCARRSTIIEWVVRQERGVAQQNADAS